MSKTFNFTYLGFNQHFDVTVVLPNLSFINASLKGHSDCVNESGRRHHQCKIDNWQHMLTTICKKDQ